MNDMISIHPTIQARIDRMRRRQAEEQANRDAVSAIIAEEIALELERENKRLVAANAGLLRRMHAMAGYPKLMALPAPEVMA